MYVIVLQTLVTIHSYGQRAVYTYFKRENYNRIQQKTDRTINKGRISVSRNKLNLMSPKRARYSQLELTVKIEQPTSIDSNQQTQALSAKRININIFRSIYQTPIARWVFRF